MSDNTGSLDHPVKSTQDQQRFCPALLVSAPASGQGKTTVTAALARHFKNQGLVVRVFKVGPDFLDPSILQCASGEPVWQLDLWMGGENHCQQLLYEAAGKADLILIEGVMGLFDGDLSSADLSRRFQIPVLGVIDGSAMAQTFGAIAHGLAHFQSGLPFAGVFANRIASDGHFQMLAESMPEDLKLVGWLQRNQALALPERHLGIVHGAELDDLEHTISSICSALKGQAMTLPPPSSFSKPKSEPFEPWLKGKRIAVARDHAFAFLYHANLTLLQSCGAELEYFSPLEDQHLPFADALYLPGGYPELHMEKIAANSSMKNAIHDHHAKGLPIVAECGGMLYLLDSLTDQNGTQTDMLGLLPGHAHMQQRLSNIGMHTLRLPEGELRGHTFHYSKMSSKITPLTYSHAARFHGTKEAVYRLGRLTASYLHSYFPSNPKAAAKLFLP